MKKEIFTKSVVLHVYNKKLPPLTIQEADNYLRTLCDSLVTDQSITIDIEVVFTDNLKITEKFDLVKFDSLLDNIIRYHLIGIIRFKAGLLTSHIDPVEYKKNLAAIDTEFYKKLFNKYSFFYSSRKVRRGENITDALEKLRIKYNKFKKRDLLRIERFQLDIKFYEGVLVGINTPDELKQDLLDKKTSELIHLKKDSEKYSFISGVLEGIKITGSLLLVCLDCLPVFINSFLL